MKTAIVIGHNSGSKGMYNYQGEPEFIFNSKVSTEVKLNLPEIDIFQRIPGHYTVSCTEIAERVAAHGTDIAIELHCNSFSRPTLGAELLMIHGADYQTAALGNFFLKNFVQETRFANRGVKQLRQSDRGFRNLEEYQKAGVKHAFLFEPTFTNFEQWESKWLLNEWKEYAEVLANCVRYLQYYNL